jgi:hypothetical protein
MKHLTSDIDDLRDAQNNTEQRLQALITTVDRFIQGLRGGNGRGEERTLTDRPHQGS